MDHDIKGLVLCSVTMMEDIFRPKIFFLEPRHVLCLENGLGIAVVYLVATDPFANKKIYQNSSIQEIIDDKLSVIQGVS